MPMLHEFDTQAVHSPDDPEPDTQHTWTFPHPFDRRPRLAHGFRELDIAKGADICVKSTIQYFTRNWADCHITTWDDTTLHSAIDDIFAIPSGDDDFRIGSHMRNLLVEPDDPASVRVDFERPFEAPPKVVVFLNYIDLDKDKTWRLRTSATDIDADGFTLTIESWADTTLNAAQASWIAYPHDREHIFSTSVNTLDIRPWNQPQLRQSRAITFGDVQFRENPKVFVALNCIDIDRKANLRINAYADGVSRTGLVWHIDSWGDTVLYGGGASIIAFE